MNPTLTVITAKGQELLFFERGIKPLWQLYKQAPAMLKESFVDDKVTGLGAAVLMVAGGVGKYHTGVISRAAKEWCDRHGLQGEADAVVPYIINRVGIGQCPLEERLSKADERSYLDEIEAFVQSMAGA